MLPVFVCPDFVHAYREPKGISRTVSGWTGMEDTRFDSNVFLKEQHEGILKIQHPEDKKEGMDTNTFNKAVEAKHQIQTHSRPENPFGHLGKLIESPKGSREGHRMEVSHIYHLV